MKAMARMRHQSKAFLRAALPRDFPRPIGLRKILRQGSPEGGMRLGPRKSFSLPTSDS
jgi:hypothetical protein